MVGWNCWPFSSKFHMYCRSTSIAIRMELFQEACIKMEGRRLPVRLLTYMNATANISGAIKLTGRWRSAKKRHTTESKTNLMPLLLFFSWESSKSMPRNIISSRIGAKCRLRENLLPRKNKSRSWVSLRRQQGEGGQYYLDCWGTFSWQGGWEATAISTIERRLFYQLRTSWWGRMDSVFFFWRWGWLKELFYRKCRPPTS